MSDGTLNTRTALQRLVAVARRDQTGEQTIGEARAIVHEWHVAIGADQAGQEQVRNAICELWQSILPTAARAEQAAGSVATSNALERAIDELRLL